MSDDEGEWQSCCNSEMIRHRGLLNVVREKLATLEVVSAAAQVNTSVLE